MPVVPLLATVECRVLPAEDEQVIHIAVAAEVDNEDCQQNGQGAGAEPPRTHGEGRRRMKPCYTTHLCFTWP